MITPARGPLAKLPLLGKVSESDVALVCVTVTSVVYTVVEPFTAEVNVVWTKVVYRDPLCGMLEGYCDAETLAEYDVTPSSVRLVDVRLALSDVRERDDDSKELGSEEIVVIFCAVCAIPVEAEAGNDSEGGVNVGVFDVAAK
jgi:hypothetical protein